ncbi:restriction endonuclease subunit S [Colwellia sp. E150_009]
MTTNNKSTLNFSSFKRLKFWDYYTLSNKAKILSDYPLVELSEVLEQRRTSIKISDSELYKRCRVRVRGKGIILRDEVLGKEIKTKTQYLCKQDDFLVAEIDAKVGGYGIVPRELVDAIVSGHYFLFEINKNKLLPEFLSILSRCNGFSKQVKATGSTNYAAIRPYHVLEYLIPLPNLKTQKQTISSYKQKMDLAREQEKHAKDLEQEIDAYLLNILDIEKSPPEKKKEVLNTVQFKDVDRWAIDSIGRISKIKAKFRGKYPLVTFRNLIHSYQYGLSEKSSKESIGPPMLRMNNINNSELILDNLKYIKIDDNTFNKYKLNSGDLLFNRTNSKELVGKTALYYSDEGYTFASYLIRVVINQQKANREYINFLFNSSILQFQKNLISRQITGQANINAQEMQELLFPLPSIEKQNEIAAHISKVKSKIKELKISSAHNNKMAIELFEKKVFNS